MGKTVNWMRYYRCKTCGKQIEERLRDWKKKPEKDKNKCPTCIKKRKLAEQSARERALYGPFWW